MPNEVCHRLRALIVEDPLPTPAENLRMAFDLMEFGLAMKAQRLRLLCYQRPPKPPLSAGCAIAQKLPTGIFLVGFSAVNELLDGARL